MEAHVLARLSAPDVAFVLPRAQTGSWYAARAADPLTNGTRAALSQSLDQLLTDLRAAKARVPSVPVLLAGFSQGACLSLELVSREGPIVDACAAFTGCRVGVAGDARPVADLGGLPIVLTGSEADPWISTKAWSEAAADLSTQGARLRVEIFPQRPHELCGAEIALLESVLAQLIAGAHPFAEAV
jgi:phospholipase/carboxylesterase